jgi:hypothetical protein
MKADDTVTRRQLEPIINDLLKEIPRKMREANIARA